MRIFKGFGCRSEVLIFKEFRFCKFGFQHLQGHLRLGSTGLEARIWTFSVPLAGSAVHCFHVSIGRSGRLVLQQT